MVPKAVGVGTMTDEQSGIFDIDIEREEFDAEKKFVLRGDGSVKRKETRIEFEGRKQEVQRNNHIRRQAAKHKLDAALRKFRALFGEGVSR